MNFRSRETKEGFWMIAMIAIAFGVVIPFGGLSRAIFCTLCLGAVWLFLATVNRGFLPFSPDIGISSSTASPSGYGACSLKSSCSIESCATGPRRYPSRRRRLGISRFRLGERGTPLPRRAGT